MTNSVIEVKNLTKIYKLYDKPIDRMKEALSISRKKYHKEYFALNDINFTVNKGETVGIIGTNGAGKSTLLKILTGVLTPTSGEVSVKGKISALLELGAGFNPEYTGIENIFLNGTMMGYTNEEMEKKVPAILEFADIGDFIHQQVKTYSSGMFARLAFSVAINVEPDILIVDEALSVGDVFFQNKCFRKFDELQKIGTTILFVSHDIGSVRQLCSKVIWLESGFIKNIGSSDSIASMYIDEQRSRMNKEIVIESHDEREIFLQRQINNNGLKSYHYPKIQPQECSLNSSDLEIISCFICNEKKEIINQLEVDKNYTTHIIVKFKTDIPSVIIGFVIENNKGMPMFDINNFISQKKVFDAKKGMIIELIFEYRLPKIMKGQYIISVALASGTQSNHIMKTWLHGIFNIEIINNGFNSSWIEIDSNAKLNDITGCEIILV